MFNFGGGQLPSFGQMRQPQMGGQQQMRPLGQMWQQSPGQMQPMGQQPTGQLPPMGGDQTHAAGQQQVPGMVPGVPGSMGLNPGANPMQQNSLMSRVGGMLQGQFQGNPLQAQFAGHPGGGFGQFMQSGPFQTMMQSPEAQSFLQSNPQFSRYLSRGQSPQQGPIMRPMGA